jgi:hypothetical protein
MILAGSVRILTAALHQEEDWFIAQCLEVDVASQGHTIDEALASFPLPIVSPQRPFPRGSYRDNRTLNKW